MFAFFLFNFNRIISDSIYTMNIHTYIHIHTLQVHISHGHNLHNKVPDHLKLDPLWVEGGEHNDIVHAFGPQYFGKLHEFFHHLEGEDFTPAESGGGVHSPVHRGLQGSAEGPRGGGGRTSSASGSTTSHQDVNASLQLNNL
jgi:hypothetical protein